MFGILAGDGWTAEELRYLAPHFGAWKMSSPRAIGDNMPLPKPVVSSALSYLYDYPAEERVPDRNKLELMKNMFTMKEHYGSERQECIA